MIFSNLFKRQPDSNVPQEAGETETPTMSEFERQMLELSRKEAERNELEARLSNPELDYKLDEQKHLNPDRILETKGLPVEIDKDTGIPFISPNTLKYWQDKEINSKVKELENFAKQTAEQTQRLKVETQDVNVLANYLNQNFPNLTDKMVTVESIIPHLSRPDLRKLIDNGAEEEALKIAVQLAEHDALVAKQLERTEGIAKYRKYSDGSEVPRATAESLYELDQKTKDNPYQEYAGKQVIIPLPDNLTLEDRKYADAMLHAASITNAFAGLSKDYPHLVPQVHLTSSRDFEDTKYKVYNGKNVQRDQFGIPTSVVIDRRYLPSASA